MRKELLKKENQRQKQIELSNAIEDPKGKPKPSFQAETPKAEVASSGPLKFDMYEEELRGLKLKYKKGLIDVEEYERTSKVLQLRYGRREE